MRVKTVTALAVVVLLLAGLTACSKKDDSSVGTAEGSTTTTEAGASGSGSGAGLPDLGDLGDLEGAEELLDGMLGEGCLAASSYFVMTGLAGFAALGGLTDADVAEYEQTLQELAGDLPAELRGDIEVVSEAYSQYFDAFTGLPEGANLFDPAISSQLEEAGKVIDTPEFNEANGRITAWLEQNCNGMR
jgi:hypothetical protein